MGQMFVVCAVCAVLFASGASGQIVTFNSPLSWTTQRNDSITVRSQIDTAQVKKKQFDITVELVGEKGRKKQLAKKRFKIDDYSCEFSMGTINQTLVGGFSFIKINWKLPGTENKGYLAPIGIVALDKLPPAPVDTIVRAPDGADAAAVAKALPQGKYLNAGADKFGFAWNKQALYIVCQKNEKPAAGTLRFALDGKNGKNAFLSFADRVVMYAQKNDSLWGAHFKRVLNIDTIKYDIKPWPNEITKSQAGDAIVIAIPWFDSGIIPFEDRRFGMGVMAFDDEDRQTAALPEKADFFLPGTWNDFVLAK
jgi:hypothetical protein